MKFRTSTKHNLRCVLGTHQGVFGEHMKRCVLIHSSMCVVLKTKKVCYSNTPYLRVYIDKFLRNLEGDGIKSAETGTIKL